MRNGFLIPLLFLLHSVLSAYGQDVITSLDTAVVTPPSWRWSEELEEFRQEQKAERAAPPSSSPVPSGLTRNITARDGRTVTVPVIPDADGNDLYPFSDEGFFVYSALCAVPAFGEANWDGDVRRWVRHYVFHHRKNTQKMLARYARWQARIREDMSLSGVPPELSVLCMVESACTYEALSPAGAAGMWQFMPETAEDYGLRVGWEADERLDPVLSSRAAVMYLRDLYAGTGDWALAAAAYNCGPGAVASAVRRAGTARWDAVKGLLPEETRQYVPSMVALHFVWTWRDVLGLQPEAR